MFYLQLQTITQRVGIYFQKRKTKTTRNGKSNKTQPTPEWGQLGQPAVTGALSPASFSQPPRMPPSTPGSSFSTKVPSCSSPYLFLSLQHSTGIIRTYKELLGNSLICTISLDNNNHSLAYQMQIVKFQCSRNPLLFESMHFEIIPNLKWVTNLVQE